MSNNTVQSQKHQEYSRIKNIIHLIIGDSPLWEWVEKYNCFQPKYESPLKSKTVPSVPDSFYINPSKREKPKNHNSMYDSLAWFRELNTHKFVHKKWVLKAAKQITAKRGWLLIEKADGTRVSVEARAKGTESYCKQQNGKILDFCKEIGAKDKDCAFITLTCDPELYENRADAWEHYKEKEIDPVMENLRKNYDVEYVSCLESTKNKRPHVHILAFFPKGLFPELEKKKNETVLRKGKLFDYVESHKTSEQVKIKVVKGEHKAFYLTKYIGKGVTRSVFKILENEKKISPEDWKQLYEFVYLTAFRKRKVLMTRRGCKKEKASASEVAQASVSAPETASWESMTDAERRSLLNSLCTNSLLRNPKTIYSMSYLTYKTAFGHFPERNQNVSEEEAEIFEKNAELVYDEENFYTLFVDFILSPKTAKLNRKFYWNAEEDIYDLFTDKYDLTDDADFLRCCKDLVNFYVEECVVKGYPLRDVISGRAGLSCAKYQHKIGFGQWDDVCSDDPKEVYKTFEEELHFRQTLNKGLAFAIERQELALQEKYSQSYQEAI